MSMQPPAFFAFRAWTNVPPGPAVKFSAPSHQEHRVLVRTRVILKYWHMVGSRLGDVASQVETCSSDGSAVEVTHFPSCVRCPEAESYAHPFAAAVGLLQLPATK